MDVTVAQISQWCRDELDRLAPRFGGRGGLYRHLAAESGISEFTVRNFHVGEKDNPTQKTLDHLAAALKRLEGEATQ